MIKYLLFLFLFIGCSTQNKRPYWDTFWLGCMNGIMDNQDYKDLSYYNYLCLEKIKAQIEWQEKNR